MKCCSEVSLPIDSIHPHEHTKTGMQHYRCPVRLRQNRVSSHLLVSPRRKHRYHTSVAGTLSKSFSIWTRTSDDLNYRPIISGQASQDSAVRRRDRLMHVSRRLRAKMGLVESTWEIPNLGATMLYQPVLCFFWRFFTWQT